MACLSAALHLFTHLYLFVCKSHCGCSYFLCLSGSSLLLGDCASDGPVCALLTTSKGICVLKKASVWSVPTVPFYFPALCLRYSAGKGKTCSRLVLLVTECYSLLSVWKIQLACGFSWGFFRGHWMQRRGRQRDVTTRCEIGFKPMLLWLHGLWANGLKAPWQSLVCFRAAAHSFCSVQIQFCFACYL